MTAALLLLVVSLPFFLTAWILVDPDRFHMYFPGIGLAYSFGKVRRILLPGYRWILPWQGHIIVNYSQFSEKLATGQADPHDPEIYNVCQNIAGEIENKLRAKGVGLENGTILSYFSMEAQGSLLRFRAWARGQHDGLPFWTEENLRRFSEGFWELAEKVGDGEEGIFQIVLLSLLFRRWMSELFERNGCKLEQIQFSRA